MVLAMYTVPKPVNRCPLHAAYVGATLSAIFILVTAEGASAHVDVQPRLAEQGKIAELRVELPQLRPGAAPVRLELEAPGMELLSSRLQAVVGSETRWTVRVRVDAEPGRLELVLRPVYADGKTVEVHDALTVVPAAETSGFPWTAVILGTGLALGLAIAALGLARRRG
jgi:hypothetical protein